MLKNLQRINLVGTVVTHFDLRKPLLPVGRLVGWWVVLPSIEINIRVTGNFSSKALIDPPSSRKKQKQCLKV